MNRLRKLELEMAGILAPERSGFARRELEPFRIEASAATNLDGLPDFTARLEAKLWSMVKKGLGDALGPINGKKPIAFVDHMHTCGRIIFLELGTVLERARHPEETARWMHAHLHAGCRLSDEQRAELPPLAPPSNQFSSAARAATPASPSHFNPQSEETR